MQTRVVGTRGGRARATYCPLHVRPPVRSAGQRHHRGALQHDRRRRRPGEAPGLRRRAPGEPRPALVRHRGRGVAPCASRAARLLFCSAQPLWSGRCAQTRRVHVGGLGGWLGGGRRLPKSREYPPRSCSCARLTTVATPPATRRTSTTPPSCAGNCGRRAQRPKHSELNGPCHLSPRPR